jgi:hypothetical protein
VDSSTIGEIREFASEQLADIRVILRDQTPVARLLLSARCTNRNATGKSR